MMSRRPVIGIPAAMGKPSATGYVHQHVGAPYVRALEEAGGLPLILPITDDRDLAAEMLLRVDGLLLQGGGDLDPSIYGEAKHPMVLEFSPETDRFELGITRECVDRDLPLLAICRGIQVLNVALGGSLIQDLPSQQERAMPHRQQAPRHAATHVIHITEGSRLARILGASELAVNTFHHQAIARTAEGLVVTARSDDGVIEAVEAPERDYVVGVQFHPEETTHSVPATALLFRELVDRARKHGRAAG